MRHLFDRSKSVVVVKNKYSFKQPKNVLKCSNVFKKVTEYGKTQEQQ